MQNNRLITAAALLLVIVLLLVAFRYGAPPPEDDDATGFSAARALPILRQLVGSGVPHPTGSAENAAVRDRIVALLRSYGYDPQIQRAFSCWRNGACATVENILARHSSGGGRPAVLVAVHYDSVYASPGASDDGMAVAAVLEIARMLRSEQFRNDIIFLIDDGEEQGLLGAQAFVEQHPWVKDVGGVVNIEARGTSGASLMFETNARNGDIIRLAAGALKRPATNSIYYTIYKLLPNDTDFTVFKEQPWIGVNFGVVGNPERYHTPLDSFENASPASLQHHGDNILAMTRALANSDLPPPSGDDVVFFDFLSLGIVLWPAPWTPVVALFVVILFGTGVLLSKQVSLRETLFGSAAFLVVVVVTAVAAHFLSRGLTAIGAFPTDWISDPAPYLITFWALPLAVVLLLGSLLARWNPVAIWAGVWLVWALGAAALSFYEPAFSYPFLIAAALAGVGSCALGSEALRAFVVLLPMVGAALLVFPFAWLLYTGMGAGILPVISVLVGLVLAGLLPAATKLPKIAPAAVLVVAVIGILVGLVVPAISPKAPAPAPVTLYQDEEGMRSLLLDLDSDPTEAMIAAGFSRSRTQPFSWDPSFRPYRAGVAVEPLLAPGFNVADVARERERLAFQGRLVSNRGAPITGLMLPAARITEVIVNGKPVLLRKSRSYWRTIRVMTTPPEGVEIGVTLRGGQPASLYAFDVTPGLPAEVERAAASRGEAYVPIGSGDRVMVSRRVEVP